MVVQAACLVAVVGSSKWLRERVEKYYNIGFRGLVWFTKYEGRTPSTTLQLSKECTRHAVEIKKSRFLLKRQAI